MAKLNNDWASYPMGTKAYSSGGGHWLKVPGGWKWCTGATFPTPGGDVSYVMLPKTMGANNA